MKPVYLLMLLSLLPSVGCFSLPVKEKEPSAARGKDADVAAVAEESETTAFRQELPRLLPDDISETNYQQQLDALRDELMRDRTAVGSIDANRPALAERK